MRIAILSDIHGNKIALDAVLQDLASKPIVDQIVIAGDLCLNGPCPRQVLDIIQELRCPVIQGNVDMDVVSVTAKKNAKKHTTIQWTREQIRQEGIDYLASLPTSYLVTNPEGSDLLVVHANPLNLEDGIFPTTPDDTLEHLLGGLKPTIGALAFGHYHVAYTRHWHHLLLCDVGSCGLPRDGDPRASYAILTWQDTLWQAEICRVEYDVNAVVQQLKNSGIPSVKKRIKILIKAKY